MKTTRRLDMHISTEIQRTQIYVVAKFMWCMTSKHTTKTQMVMANHVTYIVSYNIAAYPFTAYY